jgi:adenylate cyclase
MKKIKFIVLPLVVFIVLQLIFVSGYWTFFEHKAQDILFQLRGTQEVSDDVVIVEVSDDTFSSLGVRWPYPREYHAHLIDNLEAAGVKQIIFDVEFTEYSNPESDSILAATAAKYDNVIFAGKFSKEIRNNYVKEKILPPIKPITERGLKWGTVNISSDTDGFVRRYDLFQKRGKNVQYSIGLLAAALVNGDKNWDRGMQDNEKYFKLRDFIIPKVTTRSTRINYYGPSRTFTTFDFADVMDDSTVVTAFEKELDFDLNQYDEIKDKLKDKIVLIGISAVEFHDTHSTPFSSNDTQLMPGVEIHANFIEMVLNNNFIKDFAFLNFMIFFFILCFVLFILNSNIRPNVSIFVNAILLIGYIALAFYVFNTHNVLLSVLEVPVLIFVMYIAGLVVQYLKTSQERKFIKSAFGQYIAPELVDELIKDPKKLEYGGTQKEISVLFSDIVAFTPYTESHTPKETVELLREYLTAMVEVIMKNKGTLDKFVGDEIIALFGAPIELEDHAYLACKTALEMKERLGELTEKWAKENKDPFRIGIGINSGMVTVGNLGSEQIFDYTAIGDNMNAGARIEASTRNYETKHNIIISESTFKIAADRLIAEYLDDAKVKGKEIVIPIYELLGLKKEF